MSHPLAECALPLTLVEPPPEPLLAPLGQTRLGDRATGLELILEGFLFHHGSARLARTDDGDVRLLAGDYCYADGLATVAEAGDIGAVRALARLIAVASGLVAEGRVDALVALWHATAHAIGGDDAARGRLSEAVDRLADGDDRAIRALADPASPGYRALTEVLA